jgi:small conductance mechanosensitive channel
MNLLIKKITKKLQIFIFLILIIFTAFLTLKSPQLVQAQISLPNYQTLSKPPRGVTRYGAIEVTMVKSPLDGKDLFEIASTTIFDRTNINEVTEEKLPVEIRAEQVTANLQRALFGRIQHLKSLQISISTLNNQPIIQVSDQEITRPLKLVTVTELDVDFYGKLSEELAEEWKTILQEELDKSFQMFESSNIIFRMKELLYILGGTLLISALLWGVKKLLDHQVKQFKIKQKESIKENHQEQKIEDSPYLQEKTIFMISSQFISEIKHKFFIEKRLSFYYLGQWLIFWLQILIWYSAIVWIVSIIPILMQHKKWLLGSPISILFICFFYSFAIKLTNWVIDLIFNAWNKNKFLSLGENERKEMRTATISQAIKGFFTVLFFFYAITEILDIFGVSTTSIIAGSAIIAFGVSLGAQNLVKDLINGFLILLEDQYAVGDYIDLGTSTGLVENLNLRVTQIRDSEGCLVTIPNSSIVQVKNLTRNWSRVNFTIQIDCHSNIDLALKLLNQVGVSMFNAEEWRDKILELPQVLGVDNISNSGLLIRVWIKTIPLEQWSIEREFRYRVHKIFEENKIAIGKPQWISLNKNIE